MRMRAIRIDKYEYLFSLEGYDYYAKTTSHQHIYVYRIRRRKSQKKLEYVKRRDFLDVVKRMNKTLNDRIEELEADMNDLKDSMEE